MGSLGLIGVAAVSVVSFRSGIYYVQPGMRAFKFNAISGVGEKVYREGYNFKIPLLERAVQFDCRARPQTIKCSTGS